MCFVIITHIIIIKQLYFLLSEKGKIHVHLREEKKNQIHPSPNNLSKLTAP